MGVWHPLNLLPDGWPVWATFLVLLALGLFAVGKTAGQLKTPESPHNAISLELAWSERRAQEIVGAWRREKLIEEARRHLRWDNVFIFLYSTLAALGGVMAARAFFPARAGAGFHAALLAAWLPWLAGLLDYVENWAICRMLDGFEGGALPRLATSCAAVKFALIIPLGVWGLVGAAAYLFKSLRGTL